MFSLINTNWFKVIIKIESTLSESVRNHKFHISAMFCVLSTQIVFIHLLRKQFSFIFLKARIEKSLLKLRLPIVCETYIPIFLLVILRLLHKQLRLILSTAAEHCRSDTETFKQKISISQL